MRRSDPAFYESALRRIKLIILILGLAGAVLLAVRKDVRFGGGFLIGAAASYLSFWRWQVVVESIGGPKVRRSPWLSGDPLGRAVCGRLRYNHPYRVQCSGGGDWLCCCPESR